MKSRDSRKGLRLVCGRLGGVLAISRRFHSIRRHAPMLAPGTDFAHLPCLPACDWCACFNVADAPPAFVTPLRKIDTERTPVLCIECAGGFIHFFCSSLVRRVSMELSRHDTAHSKPARIRISRRAPLSRYPTGQLTLALRVQSRGYFRLRNANTYETPG
jgi:hypothetical protein